MSNHPNRRAAETILIIEPDMQNSNQWQVTARGSFLGADIETTKGGFVSRNDARAAALTVWDECKTKNREAFEKFWRDLNELLLAHGGAGVGFGDARRMWALSPKDWEAFKHLMFDHVAKEN